MKPPHSTVNVAFGPSLPPACRAARDALMKRLDGELQPESETVVAHRADCPDCKALEDAARQMLNALPRLSSASPAYGFADRVLNRTIVQAHRPWFKRRRIWAAALALAASVVVAVFAIVRQERQTLDCRGLMVLAVPPAIPEPNPPDVAVQNPVPLRDSFQEAGAAFSALARKTVDDGFGFRIPRLPLANAKVDPLPNRDGPMAALEEVRHSATLTIAPITDSAKRAIDVFWRELGPEAKDQPRSN